ncbi:NUDIX domain-containing protein [Phycicoccus duodecadis]|uniref:NUDIX domain-containing protein n=1 Tax=Phycicoccus duodecadis TaxID=173053 RepID=A0A2N3YMW6_9MICO|nr:NUDIX domain-containing protein [Phycicoccus duodecadis]
MGMATPPLPGQPGFVVPAPEDRQRFARRAVRVLVLDEDDRLLLFLDSDLGLDPVAHWWDTPGGGVDPGEDDLDAVVRELAEETGQLVDRAAVRGPLLERQVVHGYSDKVVDQTEVFFAVRLPPFEVDSSGYTEEERLCIAETRWWTRAELAGTTDEIWPADVLALLDLVERPEDWAGGALRGPRVEESSVPL